MNLKETNKAVSGGLRILDWYFGGGGWVDRIDLDTLDVRHEECCVLGQLFGDYNLGLDQLRLNNLPIWLAVENGFDCQWAETDYAKLTGVWAGRIAKRQAKRAVAVIGGI